MRRAVFAFALIHVCLVAPLLGGTVTLVSENFDGIGTSATATLPSSATVEWRADRLSTVRTLGTFTLAGTATTERGGNSLSTSAANGIYNFGAGAAATAADRAVGFLSSGTTPLGTQSGNLYVEFATGTNPITSFTISYDVEKYRRGTNAAGFSIQMYYSLDGTNWTTAGSNFLTSFAADPASPGNTGYDPAPGVTSSIVNQSLAVAATANTNFYLAWNYSVTSGSTTSNAQALGIDNVSVTGNTPDVAPVPLPGAFVAGLGLFAVLGSKRVLGRRNTIEKTV